MAVQPQTPYKEYTANGSTKSFALEFDCENQDHLIVLVDEVEPIVGTWSLSNGAVVFGTAPTTGKKITVQRNTPFRRDGDFQSYDNSFRPGPVNKGFDWIWLKLQELGVADWILSNRIDALKNYVDDRDDELKGYLLEEIRKQGVALDQLEDYYNFLMTQLAMIAVNKGWLDSFVATWSGRTQEQRNRDMVFAEDYGAIGDGAYHPLSEKFSTLAQAKAKYPLTAATGRLTSLTQSIDWAAIQESTLANQNTYLRKGKYVVTDTIEPLLGHGLHGQGTDYYDYWRANDVNLLRSDKEGTHIYFYGTGKKDQKIIGLANNLIPRTINGDTFEFTHFTNKDSVAGAPATPRLFSCGVKLGRDTRCTGLRVIPWFDGVNGYNDKTTTALGDEWDVGVWWYGAHEANGDKIQAVGYYRMAGVLVTENIGTDDYAFGSRNPERLILNRVSGTGARGLLVRNTPQYEVTANTNNTITVKWNNTFSLTAVDAFRANTSSQLYRYTGYAFDDATKTVTLTGVTPDLPASIGTIRSPNGGNNFSNTAFENCYFDGPAHPNTNLNYKTAFGIEPAASEYDGYPMRNLVHINTTSQSTYNTKVNTLWGNCYNFKYLACKHEGGYKISYGQEDGGLYSMDLRFIGQDNFIDPVTHKWESAYFKARNVYNDAYMFPQQFEDGTKTVFRPMPGKKLEIQDGTKLVALDIDTTRTLWATDKSGYFQLSPTVTTAAFNSFLRFRATTNGADVLKIYPTGIYPNVNFRPETSNSITSGSPGYVWSATYSAKFMFTNTVGVFFSDSGSPEGVITAGIGSTCTVGLNGDFYRKVTGIGNTGWVKGGG